MTIKIGTAGETFIAEIGTPSADSNGELDTTIVLPLATPTDVAATIAAIGTDSESNNLVLLATVAISDSITDDGDSDGVPDICDICPEDSDALQTDTDGDDIGDACDLCPNDAANDTDYDGLCADVDPCEVDPDNDLDGDGLCANDDLDDDGDGLPDYVETGTGILILAAEGHE